MCASATFRLLFPEFYCVASYTSLVYLYTLRGWLLNFAESFFKLECESFRCLSLGKLKVFECCCYDRVEI